MKPSGRDYLNETERARIPNFFTIAAPRRL
jgi:hypothetical protein